MTDILGAVTSPVAQGFLSASMRLAVPILLAALGGIYNERSGVLNIGMEGMMIVGSLVGFVAGFFLHNLWLGVLAAVAQRDPAGNRAGLFRHHAGREPGGGRHLSQPPVPGPDEPAVPRDLRGRDGAPRVNSFEALPGPAAGRHPHPRARFSFASHHWGTSPMPSSSLTLHRHVPHQLGIEHRLHGRESRGRGNTRGERLPAPATRSLMISGGLCALGGAFLSVDATGLFINNMTGGPRVHRPGPADPRAPPSVRPPGRGPDVRRRGCAAAADADPEHRRPVPIHGHAALCPDDGRPGGFRPPDRQPGCPGRALRQGGEKE